MKKFGWLGLVLLFLTVSLSSEKRSFRFEHISVEHGLSQCAIECITQDASGFIWIGTQDGLNKYDGYNFKIHNHDPANPNSLSNNVVYSIYEDHTGILWVGTFQGGLNKFDPQTEKFTHFRFNMYPASARLAGYGFVFCHQENFVRRRAGE